MPEALFAVALLACPVVMGGMMWMMMRGNKKESTDSTVAAKRDELAGLQAQVDQLQAERDHNARGATSGSSR